MARLDTLAAIQQAHHTQLLSLRVLAEAYMSEAWDAVGGFDDAAMRSFPSAAAELSGYLQGSTTSAAVAYMSSSDDVIGKAAAGALSRMRVEPIRNGVAPVTVYERAVVQARRTLAKTGDPLAAMNAGQARAVQAGRTDVILANRAAIDAGGEVRPWVVGYRRVLTGKSCALCASASTQRYKQARLHPIHPSCDCDVAEIFGTEDPGQVINEKLLEDLQAAGKADGRPDYWEGPYMVDESGAVRYRKNEYVKDPDTGAQLYNKNGGRRRRSVPGERVVPEVRQHGELGEMLTDKRHAFVDAADVPDVELPSPALQSVPEIDTSKLSAAAKRALVVPDEVVAEAKKRAPRRPARVYGVQDDDVIAAAKKFGVTPDEVLVARERVADVKGAMYEAAERVQARAFMDLDRWQALRIKTPPKLVKGSRGKAGDYDWLERLHPSERRRLSRNYYDAGAPGPDKIAAEMKLMGVRPGASDDELLEIWLRTSREYEAAGAVRRGKFPSSNAYSGSIDVDDLIDLDGGYSPRTILGAADDLDAAAHIASVDRELYADEALQYLSDAVNATEGPPPFRMSFQSWEEELRTLEYGLREFPGEMPDNARRRVAELVPQLLDDGQDYEDLYAAIVTKAEQAGMEVPDYVGIPWK